MWSFLPVYVKKRDKERISYFSAYPERWANSLGEWVTKQESFWRTSMLKILFICYGNIFGR